MDIAKVAGRAGSLLGRGLIAGLAGTAAMTITQMIEMKIEDREGSEVPARVAGKVMGVKPRNQEGKKEFSQIMHWSYGSSWGMFRAALAAAGIKGADATAIHFGAIWTTALIMVPSLSPTPHPSKWGIGPLAKDMAFHLVYAAAVGAVFDAIDKDEEEKKNTPRKRKLSW